MRFSAPRSLGSAAHHGRLASAPARRERPTSPLVATLTKQKPPVGAPKRLNKLKKNAVHPIDLRDLESELDLLPGPQEPKLSAERATSPRALQNSLVTVCVLHALDLANPCQIRSCPHALFPIVRVCINDSCTQDFPASHHARNHTSWSKSTTITQSLAVSPASSGVCIVRVGVAAHCTRHPNNPEIVSIGTIDDIIVLPVGGDASSTASAFYPVFRHQVVGDRAIKCIVGKIKLRISITPQVQPTEHPLTDTSPSLPPHSPQQNAEVGQRPVPPSSATRPMFLPANFGDALQLKRKQLKATIAPEVVCLATTKAVDDPVQVQLLLETIRSQLSRYLIPESRVDVMEAIGDGVHATVFHARLRCLHSNEPSADVAMKEFRYTMSNQPPLGVLRVFQQEVDMLTRVTTALEKGNDADAIIRFKGAMLTPRLAIFTDFCSDGSLAKCLQGDERWRLVSFQSKLALGRQIASALARLHGLQIVHRDIKPHNIMVHGLDTSHPLAKIGDLGSATAQPPPLYEETGSSGYTAPEIFCPDGYDHRADIWSLGVVLCELLTGSTDRTLVNPFVGVCGEQVVQKALQGERPCIPSDAPDWCRSLLLRCWDLDPLGRPSAEEVAKQFQNGLNGL